jgi:predicted MFS family arabinose efflux permease
MPGFHSMPPAASPALKNESLFLYCLAGIQFTHIMDFMIMMPLGPMFVRTLGIDTRQFGLLVSVYAFSAAVSGLLAASFIDRFDRKRLTLVLYLLFAGATLLCALSPQFGFLLGARALAGAFGGVLGAMVQTLIAECIPEQRRGRAMGTVMASFALSTIAGVPFGLYLANHFGWRAPFVFVAGLSLVILWIGARVLPAVPAPQRVHAHPLAPMLAVLRQPSHRRAFAFTALMMASGFLVIPFITLYMTANVDVPETSLWLIYLAGGAATLFTSRLVGVWADRYGKPRVYRWVALAAMAPILVTTHLVPVPFWLVLINSTLFFVLVSGRMVPGMALVTSSAAPSMRGAFMSVNAAVQQVSSGLASLVAGLIIGHTATGKVTGYNWVGYLAVAAGLAAIAIVGRMAPVDRLPPPAS